MSGPNTPYRDLLAVWQRWAAARGFVYVPPAGTFWSETSPRLEGQLRDVAIEIDTYKVSNGKTSIAYTRARSHAQVPLEGEVRVNLRGTLARIERSLGFHQLHLDDPAFDDRFIAHATPETLAPVLLDADTRRALLDLPVKHFSFKYAQGESIVSWVGLCRDEATLDAACALVCAAGVWRKDPTLYR